MFPSTTVTQIGLVVNDIEAAIDRYMQIFDLPERPVPIITDTVDQARTEYLGKSSPARAKLAFIPMGQVTIELIEPDHEPSTWREHLDKFGESVHHIAFQITGTGKTVEFLQTQGVPLEQLGYYTGGMYTYVDSCAKLGVRLQLLENF